MNAAVGRPSPEPRRAISDRDHPHHREAGDRIEHDANVELFERGKHEPGTEDEPEDEREQAARQFGRARPPSRHRPGRPTRRRTPDERRNERVAARLARTRNVSTPTTTWPTAGSRAAASRARWANRRPAGRPRARCRRRYRCRSPAHPTRRTRRRTRGRHAERGRRCSDAERHYRRRDTVVQPALDVEHPPDADREPLVGDHRARSGRRRWGRGWRRSTRPRRGGGSGTAGLPGAVPAMNDSGSPIAEQAGR